MTDDEEALRQQVARQIEVAFADTLYPDDNNIAKGIPDEARELEQGLRGYHWRNLTLELMYKYRNHIPNLTSDALRFYLPSFMLATINHYDEIDTLSDNLLSILSPPEDQDEDWQSYFLERTSSFNRVEQDAIVAFLEMYLDIHREDLGYGKWENEFQTMLPKAVTFWRARLESDPDS